LSINRTIGLLISTTTLWTHANDITATDDSLSKNIYRHWLVLVGHRNQFES